MCSVDPVAADVIVAYSGLCPAFYSGFSLLFCLVWPAQSFSPFYLFISCFSDISGWHGHPDRYLSASENFSVNIAFSSYANSTYRFKIYCAIIQLSARFKKSSIWECGDLLTPKSPSFACIAQIFPSIAVLPGKSGSAHCFCWRLG